MEELLIYNGEDLSCEINPHLTSLDCIRALIREDKGMVGDTQARKKLKTKKTLTWVYLLEDPRSPYMGFPDDRERHKKIVEDIFPPEEKWHPSKNAEAVRKWYSQMLHNGIIELRVLDSTLKGLDKVRKFMETMDLNETDDHGKPKWKPKEVSDTAKGYAEGFRIVSELREKVYKGIKETGKARGGVEITDFNKG